MNNFNFWTEIIVALLTGLVAAIPLVIKLVKTIKESIKAKNWTPLMQILLKLMSEAEDNYSTGEEKKAYVLDSLKALESSLNYDVDMDAISAMIDAIALASKKININKK